VRDSDGLALTLLVLTAVGDNDTVVVDVTVDDIRPLWEFSDDGLKTGVKESIALVDGDPDSWALADTDGVTELDGALLTLECDDCDAVVEDDDERDDTRDRVATCVGKPVDV
jgi:hypothetical protein